MTKTTKCGNCQAELNARTGFTDPNANPTENDYSVCAYCGAISQYDSELNLVPITPEGLVKLNDEDPDVFDVLMKARVTITQMFAKA